ncbi:hypothetical protein BGZ90_002526, partial [Linnemannia elongata]
LSEFPQLQPLMQKGLQQLGLTGVKVLSVTGETQVLEALIIMSKLHNSIVIVRKEQSFSEGDNQEDYGEPAN